ncbi:MAG: TonB family protein, partial [Alphaproteobacteria bacterium]
AASAPASKPEDSGQQDDPKPAKLAQHEPDAPDAPKAPDDPDAPQEPAAPSSPASPDEPDAPTAPDTPSAPKEPEPEPEQKSKPDTPSDAPPKHVDTNAPAQDVAQAEGEGEPDADGEAELASEAEDEAPHAPEDATDPSENTTPPQSVAAIDLSPPVPASHPRRQTTHVSHSSQRHTTSRSHRRRKRRLSRLRQRRPSRRQVIVYRRSVRAYLAENKPIGGQGKGFVRVSFILSSTGRLVSARIIGSSGNHLLNQAVLNAVHNASPFPKPPARIRASRLRFNIPFYFH